MDTKKMRWVSGNSVIEMSYIMPLFFSLFVIIIHTVFYYHDKAIIGGAAAESAVIDVYKRQAMNRATVNKIFQKHPVYVKAGMIAVISIIIFGCVYSKDNGKKLEKDEKGREILRRNESCLLYTSAN